MKITGVKPWLVTSQSPYLDTAGEAPRQRTRVYFR